MSFSTRPSFKTDITFKDNSATEPYKYTWHVIKDEGVTTQQENMYVKCNAYMKHLEPANRTTRSALLIKQEGQVLSERAKRTAIECTSYLYSLVYRRAAVLYPLTPCLGVAVSERREITEEK